MRERINRLAKGIVDSEIPSVTILPEAVSETVQAGTVTKKELYVTDVQGRFIKGLAYSSNMRVRICDSAFGGSRNRIIYEVDSRHLSKDDKIEGSFCLVTNGGEKTVPYSFAVELGVSGRTLDSLKEPADFAALARRDYELALRLFEYQDFTEAPFMQDLHTRALYDGLKGRLNRQNQLEEFLVALRAKKPVELNTDQTPRRYEDVKGNVQDQLKVKASDWGYVQFEVSAEGDFLDIPKKSYGWSDFTEGLCAVPFEINGGRLHRGRNLGVIRITTVKGVEEVPVEAVPAEEAKDKFQQGSQKDLRQYLTLRLEFEAGLYEDSLLINQMRQVLDRMRKQNGESAENTLRLAELYILDGQAERARVMLNGLKKEFSEDKQDDPSLIFFYQYLLYLTEKQETARETLLGRVKRRLEADPHNGALFLLKIKLEGEEGQAPAERLDELKAMFQAGCHSPYLYAHAFDIYRKNPALLGRMDEYAVQVMIFGAKHGLVDQELALEIAGPAASSRHYRRLYCRLLMDLYEKYEDKELLSAVCCLLIKGDCRGKEYFSWYQKALEAGISLTRLYEYYLYSLPYDYPYLLPKEVLLYFSYEKSMDDFSRSMLYMNILKYMSTENPLYRQYERDIEQFTMEQLLKSRINRRYVVLYQHMLYREMIDEKVARVLPSILKSYRVRVSSPRIRYVIVCYEEMEGEDAFPVKDGVAYVPLFSQHPVLLFQDDFGNRYADISYRKLPAMEKQDTKELEEACYDIYPDHPMLQLQECGKLVAEGISDEADVLALKRALADLKLHPLFRRRIFSCLIEWYRKRLEDDEADTADDVDYLMDLDFDKLSRQERAGVCETLIRQEYVREAYGMIKDYGCEDVRSSRLLKLCSRMILQQLSDADDTLLYMAWRLFSEGKYDSVVLDYLCEHFNGSTKHMFKVLNQGEREHVEVYDMPERLLAQMLFTGETDRMDQVFSWYMAGKNTSDHVVKAYFTMKSADYFLRDKATDDQVFAWLEGAVYGASDKNRIPTIYLLALSRYYATLKELDEERKKLGTLMTGILLEENRVFSWFKDLGRLIPMPDSVMDKAIIEYHGGRESKPELQVRILPEEEEYAQEEFTKSYPGIFVRLKVLFEGEILEYRVYEPDGDQRRLAAEGSLSCDPTGLKEEKSRFAALNEMSLCLSVKEEAALQEKMRKYVTDNAMMEELFGLM